jgi:putative FmdB family regulatory protein
MPTYEYECADCGHTFERNQSMSEEPIRVCPACAGRVRRVINGGMGVIFKGSGFYVNDSKGSKTPASKSPEKKPEAAPAPAAAPASGPSGAD